MKRSKISSIHTISFMGKLLIVALAAQTSCAPVGTMPPRTVSSVHHTGAAQPEKPPAESLPGLIVTEIEEKKEQERLYSFSLRGANIREVLMAIAKQTSFNIVVDPDISGNVTLDLKDVTLRQALDTLTDLSGLTYSAKGNIIRVVKPFPETRIFSLQYVNLKRTGYSSTTAQIGTGGGGASGGISTGGTTGITGTTGSTGVSSGGSAGGTSGQTTVTTTTETDLWKDVEAGVKSLLSPEGKAVVDKQSGNILVTDHPKILDRVAVYLESIEGSVQRQVLIEARVLEVVLTGKYHFGLDWGAIAQAGALKGASAASPGRIFGQQLIPTNADTGRFQIGVVSTDFSALLDVLSTQGEINVLSNPKLATLNNQTAVIRSATDEVFFERRVIETFVDGTPRVTTDVIPRTVTVGVVLAVTPQISSDGSVVLHIRPTVTDRTGEATFQDGATVFTAPVLDVREADVVVRAREGQVVVIGGLIQNKKNDAESKVPILGDLPAIGRLFRSTTQETRKTELVVLLSPTVMVGKKIDEITSRELQRLEKSKGSSPW